VQEVIRVRMLPIDDKALHQLRAMKRGAATSHCKFNDKLTTMLRAREYCSADFQDLYEIARAIAEGWLQVADQFDMVKHGRELREAQAKGNA
jgi:hypothetical protein